MGEGPIGTLIDIGTGTGRMIELFGERADTALGIDRSSEMLRLARAKLHGRVNTELRQADLYALPLADGAADLAVIHHVLHFAETPRRRSPRRRGCWRRAGGCSLPTSPLTIARTCAPADAHVRLGFADDQVAGWFEAAGLQTARVEDAGRRRTDGEIVVGPEGRSDVAGGEAA